MLTVCTTLGRLKRLIFLNGNIFLNPLLSQARIVIEEANGIMKVIPGRENYYYKKYFSPKYDKILKFSIK